MQVVITVISNMIERMNLFQWALPVLKIFTVAILGFLLLTILGGVGYMIFFNSVSNTPKGPTASPDLSNYTQESWESERSTLVSNFIQEIYGRYPDANEKLIEITRKTLNTPLNANVEQITYRSTNNTVAKLNVILVLPKESSSAVPLIIGQNFASNPTTFPFEGVDEPATPFTTMVGEPGGSDGLLITLVKLIMGEYLITPPLQDLVDRGYGFAGFYPGEIVPDNAALAPEYLKKLNTSGAISAWAWGFNRVAEVLSQDPRIDGTRVAAFGHSRHGKAALLAAVFESQINLILSHQSGTGGASLGKSGIGESIQAITDTYPHWFDPNYAKYGADQTTLPVDQHQLIALAAPTPILLGNGQHDKWSDPQTAFRALEGATPIYQLYGVEGLKQDRLNQPNFDNNLVLHQRPGPHGTRKSDWAAFIKFLQVHF